MNQRELTGRTVLICLVVFFGVVAAANAVLMTLFTLLAYGLDGFATAAEQMAGQSVGARDAPGFRAAVRMAGLYCVGLGAAEATTPYTAAVARLPEQRARLEQAVVRLREVAPDIQRLSTRLDQKMAELVATVEAARRGDREAALTKRCVHASLPLDLPRDSPPRAAQREPSRGTAPPAGRAAAAIRWR